MTEEMAAVIARLEQLSNDIREHADMDSRLHQAVSLQISQNAHDAKADRDAINAKLDMQTEMMEAWEALGGFLKVAKAIGKFAAWCAGILGLVAAWNAFKDVGKS